MTRITLAQAQASIAGSLAHASERGFKPLAVVVLDMGGEPIAIARQDGASIGRVRIATGKAAGALFLGASSRQIAAMAAERPAFLASLGAIAPSGVVPAPGGVLIVGADGLAIGAIGASGDVSDADEECVLAGVTAAGLRAME